MLVSVIALCGCVCFADSAAKAPTDSSDRFVTEFGEFSPAGTQWTVRVSKADRKLQLIRSDHFSVSFSPWEPKRRWFAFIENDERVWTYDGGNDLKLDTIRRTGETVHSVSYDSCGGFPCPVPNEVLSRLSPAARQIVENHTKQH